MEIDIKNIKMSEWDGLLGQSIDETETGTKNIDLCVNCDVLSEKEQSLMIKKGERKVTG